MHIAGSSALVTGGASGLGAGVARHLVALGARVTIVDVNHEAGAALAEELGAQAQFVAADVADAEQMRSAVEAAAAVGDLRILVCCAGIATAERTLGKEGPLPLERFTRVIAVNLIGTFNAVRLAAAVMASNTPNDDGERGVVVCTASIAAFEGQIGQAAYSASKAGVAGMTLPLARELARYGIRVVSIAPGTFDTPMLAGLPEAAITALAQQVPFPSRLGRPAEFAALVQHIVENPMLNGTTIRLDGALRMGPR
ncbi:MULTISPECIES: SDR family NAD(P)-dependent oxidoreductase [unclassified Roseiflexus]|jgi:NAD(P)-dependent dehydrogenase (short-subunit alcohol dehydrogenase family)|uniref:SDR family NAD(P)-dependent oxidoreductase n=1 Tax=unclassified Roseiflexus TaxID=2609473 RepID=UPI0000D81F3A|nr:MULTISPECIES: SDR family NAD(P)-dependent oxidoreductase [unclassified Roseiflexus]ABQ90682.1 short-chain dehydrogenase/reductase SDR [Roseiflexus sp. RS-1]MBO9321435.1 SDR family NAD(P)-dependent oxidoreductase [Roseiflexus sp.]MCL6540535.1 SDR family NAD(P)-dependent oxidoreductase [Roseiflexus sp.]